MSPAEFESRAVQSLTSIYPVPVRTWGRALTVDWIGECSIPKTDMCAVKRVTKISAPYTNRTTIPRSPYPHLCHNSDQQLRQPVGPPPINISEVAPTSHDRDPECCLLSEEWNPGQKNPKTNFISVRFLPSPPPHAS